MFWRRGAVHYTLGHYLLCLSTLNYSLGLTAYEVATRAELPGNGEDWHALRGGRPIELSASWSKDLEALLRQVRIRCSFVT